MPTYQMIPLNKLRLSDGPLPDGHLVASIRRWGLFEDVLVRPWRDQFTVIAGRRRVLALQRIAEEDEVLNAGETVLVSCKIITEPDAALAASVVTNNLGKKNPLADLEAILSLREKLTKKGTMSEIRIEQEIQKELRLSAGTQRKRLKLQRLPDEVRMAVCEGLCAVSTAETIASLKPAEIKAVLRVLKKNERITAGDVREIRQTGIVKTVEELGLWERLDSMPHELPAKPEAPAAEEVSTQ